MSELVFGSNSTPGRVLGPFSKSWHGDHLSPERLCALSQHPREQAPSAGSANVS